MADRRRYCRPDCELSSDPAWPTTPFVAAETLVRHCRTNRMTNSRLADFELLLSLAISSLGSEAYGAALSRQLEQQTGRTISLGAVYKTLERLIGKGFLEAQVRAPSPERGGRRKKHYRLTGQGQAALSLTLADIDALRAQAFNAVIVNSNGSPSSAGPS